MSSYTTEHDCGFADFDDPEVYKTSKERALNPSTQNFVVEFEKDHAHIAFDLKPDAVEDLLKEERTAVDRPVRWINVWAPNKQVDVVDVIGRHYKFSPRLLAIIKTIPPPPEHAARKGKHMGRLRAKMGPKDVEGAVPMEDPSKSDSAERPKMQAHATHYAITQQMKHYQSVDFGAKFLCIGANWMHQSSTDKDDENKSEKDQRALWSWLILCDDHTVISLHEDFGTLNEPADIKSFRSNTLSVLTQLSSQGVDSADPLSMQTVRQALESDAVHGDPSFEGASSLFYYLFDDWRAVYRTVSDFHTRLEELQNEILDDVTRRSQKTADIQIIPRLHVLGRQFRQMQHLYQGYKNLISRILEQKNPGNHDHTLPRSLTNLSVHHHRVTLAQSAILRFERLSDRIEFLILSEIKEFLAEKDALINTYFNITAQKDSEATARLTRAATLLAKLSVLFLPVSLMTAYFSIQITELEGVYTTKDYWYSFATIMTISVLGLFFFAKALMWVTETLDTNLRALGQRVGVVVNQTTNVVIRKRRRGRIGDEE